jgi:hypothetical protein
MYISLSISSAFTELYGLYGWTNLLGESTSRRDCGSVPRRPHFAAARDRGLRRERLADRIHPGNANADPGSDGYSGSDSYSRSESYAAVAVRRHWVHDESSHQSHGDSAEYR